MYLAAPILNNSERHQTAVNNRTKRCSTTSWTPWTSSRPMLPSTRPCSSIQAAISSARSPAHNSTTAKATQSFRPSRIRPLLCANYITTQCRAANRILLANETSNSSQRATTLRQPSWPSSRWSLARITVTVTRPCDYPSKRSAGGTSAMRPGDTQTRR